MYMYQSRLIESYHTPADTYQLLTVYKSNIYDKFKYKMYPDDKHQFIYPMQMKSLYK